MMLKRYICIGVSLALLITGCDTQNITGYVTKQELIGILMGANVTLDVKFNEINQRLNRINRLMKNLRK